MTRKWILLIIVTMFTVVMWIGLEVLMGYTSEDVEEDYRAYLDPIEAEFDEAALEEVITRESENLLIDRDALE